jgi:hypothetical protein
MHYGTLGSSQARVSAAKLRIGYALQNPWQFAGEGGCGKLRAGLGDPEACDRQECCATEDKSGYLIARGCLSLVTSEIDIERGTSGLLPISF